MESLKRIPYSREAEQYVIASILLDQRVASDVVSRLIDVDFYEAAHQNIIKAVTHLFNEKKMVDLSTISEELKRIKLYDASGGEDYLFELMDSAPTIINVESFIEIIKERAIERELYNTLKEVSNIVLDGGTMFKDLMEMTEKKINNVINKRQTSEFLRVDIATGNVLDIIEANKAKEQEGITGIDTGFRKLNEMTFGFSTRRTCGIGCSSSHG
jgi:replicative DNA helicase